MGSQVPIKSLAYTMPRDGSLEVTTDSITTEPSAAKMAVLGLGGTVAFMNSQTPTIG